MAADSPERAKWVRRGLLLCAITVVWDLFEGVVAVLAGAAAGSVVLLGFGVDSLAELLSATVVGGRFAYEMGRAGGEGVERFERVASRIAGGLLLLVAAYILADSARRLLGFGAAPEPSLVGAVLAAAALPIMGILAWAKLRAARALGSHSLHADAYENVSCGGLAAATLAGLLLNAAFGWWWADPVAALTLLPLIVKEGIEGIRGEGAE